MICKFCGKPDETDGGPLLHRLHCDGQQGRVEAGLDRRVETPGATRSTEEAMTRLRQTRRRLIENGRQVALEQIAASGTTHSRRVLDEMDRRGLLDRAVAHDFWLGAVFHDREFVWTGQWYRHHSKLRNIHERTVKVWTVRE
jgi:hypothetical protein